MEYLGNMDAAYSGKRLAWAVALIACLLSSEGCDPMTMMSIGRGVAGVSTAMTQSSLEPQPLAEETRAKLKRVGIVLDHAIPVRHQVSLATESLSTEAIVLPVNAGSSGEIQTGESLAKAMTESLQAALLGFVAPGGGIYEALRDQPDKSASAPAGLLQKALVPARVDQFLREHFLQTWPHFDHPTFKILENTRPVPDGGAVDYRSLQARGIDAVLILKPPVIAPSGDMWMYKVPIDLSVAFRARLLSVEKNTVLYDRAMVCSGSQRSSAEWGQKNGYYFLKEVVGCYQILAETLIEEMFLLYLIPHERSVRRIQETSSEVTY